MHKRKRQGKIDSFFKQTQSKMFMCKEEAETSGLDMDTTQTKTETHGHSLRFRYKTDTCAVTCNEPMTVQERLQKDASFRAICKKNLKEGFKELVIQREQMPRAAVTPNFPCCLLNDNELLDIEFISSGGNTGAVETPKLTFHSPESLVSFYIKTRGDKNIRMVMKNYALKGMMDYVCVYAVKGERVKVALKRDGRFNGEVFSKGALFEEETDCRMNLSNLVDDLDGKQFQVVVKLHQTDSQESSQEMSQEAETVKNDKGDVPGILEKNTTGVSGTPQEYTTNQDSTNAPEKKAETPQKEKKPRKYPETREIPNTQEILKLLREQHKDLLKTLKERENLKNNAEVKRFFRVEYDKSVHSFSEVKRVKQLMELSDSVCQICVDGFPPIGTGFLLFDRFVLTNAHVVRNLVPSDEPQSPPTLKHTLSAVFNLEDVKNVKVKEKLVAYLYENDVDFALLELEENDSALLELEKKENGVKLPELLKYYSAPPIRGGVCIIGHPAGGVKRMDPCFIIAKGDVPQAADRYFKKNPNLQVFQAITQWCLLEDSEIRKSRISYHSCFFHGSSGSPVFDEYCNLIGVHTGGYVYPGEVKTTRSVMEYGLPMFPILVQIFIQCSKSGRAEVLQYFESRNNLKRVLQVANEELQGSEPMDTSTN